MYRGFSLNQLKSELSKRKALTTGRKETLIERLESYDRNDDFKGSPILLPEPIIPEWPVSGFKQLVPGHKILLPIIRREKVDAYFQYRLATDNLAVKDVKALEKGEKLLVSGRIEACSVHITSQDIHMTGIVNAAMKKKVSYNYKLRLHGETAEGLNSHCECPAGKGPHGTCKHIAAVLLMMCHFESNGEILISKSCTEKLQTFHKPSTSYLGSPVKAQRIAVFNNNRAVSTEADADDPRPLKYRRMAGYEDMVRNSVINMCSNTSLDITMRFLYQKADLKSAVADHDYLQLPFTEYWVESDVKCAPSDIKKIEISTREHARSKRWFKERQWRITASRFGDVCKTTERRNKTKLCQSIISPPELKSKAVVHGRTFERAAVEKFESKYKLKVHRCGVFISKDYPFLAATPDGVIDEDHIVEVKCPYNGHNSSVEPGPRFPFLFCEDDGKIKLKQTSNYYLQIQGQLYVSCRKYCFFIVYTFEDLLVQKISLDTAYCENCMIPKLQLFWEKHLRPFIASTL